MKWHEIFVYDKKTGFLHWKISPISRIKKGAFAGYRSKPYGYQELKYKQKDYRAHRIIWEMFVGKIPQGMEIDHIDGNGQNNRLENLRCVTHQENIKNQKRRRNSKTGQTGVALVKKRKYHATIGVSGKTINLGIFQNLTEATKVRKEAEKKYGFHPNHGRVVD